jgi:hypothetical protein
LPFSTLDIAYSLPRRYEIGAKAHRRTYEPRLARAEACDLADRELLEIAWLMLVNPMAIAQSNAQSVKASAGVAKTGAAKILARTTDIGSFTTQILLPEVRAPLLTALNQHLRNHGVAPDHRPYGKETVKPA